MTAIFLLHILTTETLPIRAGSLKAGSPRSPDHRFFRLVAATNPQNTYEVACAFIAGPRPAKKPSIASRPCPLTPRPLRRRCSVLRPIVSSCSLLSSSMSSSVYSRPERCRSKDATCTHPQAHAPRPAGPPSLVPWTDTHRSSRPRARTSSAGHPSPLITASSPTGLSPVRRLAITGPGSRQHHSQHPSTIAGHPSPLITASLPTVDPPSTPQPHHRHAKKPFRANPSSFHPRTEAIGVGSLQRPSRVGGWEYTAMLDTQKSREHRVRAAIYGRRRATTWRHPIQPLGNTGQHHVVQSPRSPHLPFW
jgi:hypothetical protein